MKLHKIVTENLNSLYGPQEIDLDETLGNTSLFLVFGPTGSGKSTIMDAVSLALFGETPRLYSKRGDPTRDPRAIMSRGTAEASAKVEFSKVEGGLRRRYRVTWTCRKANNRPDGNLQNESRTIERLEPDDSWHTIISSEKKKEFQPKFNELLEGFGVGDFNRSMLLAQGQFDAFLGAEADERAEILERLTNTAVFKEIGDRAAQVNKRHKKKIEKLETLANAGGGLDPESLGKLQEAHQKNTTARTDADHTHKAREAELKWLTDEIVHQKKLDEVKGEITRHDVEILAFEPKRSKLMEHERCENGGGFKALDERDSAQESVLQVQEDLEKLEQSLPGLQESENSLKDRALTAQKTKENAETRFEDLRPLVESARSAIAAHEAASEMAKNSLEQHAISLDNLGTAEVTKTAATDGVNEAQSTLTPLQSDLELHRSDAKLAEVWPGIQTKLTEFMVTSTALQKQKNDLGDQATKLTEERSTIDAARGAYKTDRDARLAPFVAASVDAKSALQTVLGTADYAESYERHEKTQVEAEKRYNRSKDVKQPVFDAEQAAVKFKATEEQIVKDDATSKEYETEVSKLKTIVEHKGELRELASKAVAGTERIAALAVHRDSLVDGDPCPLCGAEEHPFAHSVEKNASDKQLQAEVDQAQQLAEQAAAALKEATETYEKKRELAQIHAGGLAGLVRQKEEEADTFKKLKTLSLAALESVGLPQDSILSEVEDLIRESENQLEATKVALRTLDKTKKTSDEAEGKLRQAKEAEEERQKQLDRTLTEIEEREKSLVAAEQEYASKMDGFGAQADELKESLAPHGLTLDAENPKGCRDEGSRRVESFDERTKAVAAAQKAFEIATNTLAGEIKRYDDRVQACTDAAKVLALHTTTKDLMAATLGEQRQKLAAAWGAIVTEDPARPASYSPSSDGAPKDLQDAQERWLKHTRSVFDEANRLATDAGEKLRLETNRRDDKAEDLKKLATALSLAEATLLEAKKALGFDDVEGLKACRLAADQLAEFKEQNKSLERTTVTLKTLLDERQTGASEHRVQRPELLALDATAELLAVKVTEAADAFKSADTTYTDTYSALKMHGDNVQKHEEARQLLAKAEAEAKVWFTLHGLIGVKDGDRFKQFAQAMNLQRLLDKANVHLKRLAPRYELIPRMNEGLPTLEFDLSDLWQIGERVAPCALSGGERFLVSLSLALGLSDFRAVEMPIETLLLDEGFGTLDADTLSVALGALSQLQASGRQIGIISHVVGLRERIEARIEVRPLGAGRSKIVTEDSVRLIDIGT